MGLKALHSETKKKVLYIDDDTFSQAIVTAALNKNFTVTTESSGANAIEQAEAVFPHLILLDLSMPNIDGFDVLLRLKSHPILSAIPVICLSGKQDEASRTRSYKLGASGFITKPVDVKQLDYDINHILKSMNTEIKSADKKRHVFVGFNTEELSLKLRENIESELSIGKKVVVLSCSEGESFYRDVFTEEIPGESERLAFLHIKPALITRLPYLESLSPITDELRTLLKSDLANWSLFFDRPDIIVGLRSNDNSTAATLLLSETLNKTFSSVRYYLKSATEKPHITKINNMAKILIGER